MSDSHWMEVLRWHDSGLLPAIAQDYDTGDVLTLAWMNRESLQRTVDSGYATYWSRSRQCLWRKGATSGHLQQLRELRLDCDGDTLLLLVLQVGVACHTGHWSCFHQQLDNGRWLELPDALKRSIPEHE